MESESTAVVAREHPHIVSDADVEAFEKFRRMGSVAVAVRKEQARLRKQLDGTEWGHALQVSDDAKNAIVEWARVIGADLQRHIDMMGKKPWLNSAFYADKMNQDPLFHHYEQRDLSAYVETGLRERAERMNTMAATVEEHAPADAAKLRLEAFHLVEEADQLRQDRVETGAPPSAVAVIETTIWRFISAAPLEKIQAGEVTDLAPYLVQVVESNWAGGRKEEIKAYMASSGKDWNAAKATLKPDPIGDANPTKTARTRSLRRCGEKAFSTWMRRNSEQQERMQAILEAQYVDFTVMEEPEPGVIAAGGGEPTGGHGPTKQLPVRSEVGPGAPAAEPGPKPEPQPGPPAQGPPLWPDEQPPEAAQPEPEKPQEPAFEGKERQEAHRRFFATLKDAGIASDRGRKEWMKENGLGTSTKKWGRREYEKAVELLVGPVRDKVIQGCTTLGQEVGDLALKVLGKDSVEYLKDWNVLLTVVEARLPDPVDTGDDL